MFIFKYNKDKVSSIKYGVLPNKEPLEPFLKRREEMFFNNICKTFPITLINDPENPVLIYNNSVVLSAYIKNFNLIIKSDSDNANSKVIFSEDIENLKTKHSAFYKALQTAIHRKAYKIKHSKADLYLSGRNYIDRKNKDTEFPVFSQYTPNILTHKVAALLEQFRFAEYPLDIVSGEKDEIVNVNVPIEMDKKEILTKGTYATCKGLVINIVLNGKSYSLIPKMVYDHYLVKSLFEDVKNKLITPELVSGVVYINETSFLMYDTSNEHIKID